MLSDPTRFDSVGSQIGSQDCVARASLTRSAAPGWPKRSGSRRGRPTVLGVVPRLRSLLATAAPDRDPPVRAARRGDPCRNYPYQAGPTSASGTFDGKEVWITAGGIMRLCAGCRCQLPKVEEARLSAWQNAKLLIKGHPTSTNPPACLRPELPPGGRM